MLLLGISPKELNTGTQAETPTPMFITALCMTSKRCKQPKHPPNSEWINKRWSFCAVECHSVMKRKEALTQATMWIHLKNTTPAKRSQTQKVVRCMVPFT